MTASPGWSQTTPQLKEKIQLEDVKIQGESGRYGQLLQNRNRFELDSRIKPKTEFKKELQGELERLKLYRAQSKTNHPKP